MKTQTTTGHKRNWWSKFIAFFTGLKNDADAAAQEGTESEIRKKNIEEVRTITDEFFQVINEIDSYDHKLLNKINTYILSFVSKYSRLGLSHGERGTKDFMIGVSARSWAAQITEHVYSKVKGGSDGLAAQIAAKQHEKTKLEAEYESSKTFYHKMLDYSQNHYQSFSLTSAVIYLIAGPLLMLADLPISFSLVGYFGIGNSDPADTLLDKMHDHDKFLFALGICLASIYIKSLYDEYINTPAGSWGKAVAEAKGNGKRAIVAELTGKLLVKLVILTGLLFTFYYLGVFRNAFNDEIGESVNGIQGDIGTVRLYSFIGLTVVIPAISGICLSKGFSILANKSALSGSSARTDRSFAKYQASCNECNDLLVLKSQLDACHEEWQDKHSKISNISQQFVCAYEQGYKTAYRMTFGKDLFRMAEEYQVELSTKQLQNLFTPKMVN